MNTSNQSLSYETNLLSILDNKDASQSRKKHLPSWVSQLNKSGFYNQSTTSQVSYATGETETPEAPHCQCVSCRVVTINLSGHPLGSEQNPDESEVTLASQRSFFPQNWPCQLFSKFIFVPQVTPATTPTNCSCFRNPEITTE